MSSHEKELTSLVSELVDDDIDEKGFARLNVLLESDAESPAIYIRLMHHHADLPEITLRATGDEPAAVVAENGQSAERPSWVRMVVSTAWQAKQIARKPTSISIAAAAIVIGLFIALLGVVALPLYRESAQQLPQIPERIVVAQLTRWHEAQWPAQYGDGGPGRYLFAGSRIELSSGYAEITFSDGAAVVLQGPTVFQASSSNSGHAERGRLTALVPAKAIGFSIRTPRMEVTDLGTEFGLFVDDDGATSVDVFTGSVEVAPIDDGETSPLRLTLSAGESARIAAKENGIEQVEPSSEKLVRPRALTKLIDEHGYRRWSDFIATLQEDPDVVALYPFEQSEGKSDEFHNAATGDQGQPIARIEGAAWESGRWEKKQALHFQHAGDYVELGFDEQPLEQLTLATWVRLDELKLPLTALFHSNEWNRTGAVHWTMRADGRVELAVFGSQPTVVHSGGTLLHRRLGRWVHLAVVYDTRQKTAQFFLNGAPSGQATFTTAEKADLRKVQLGNWSHEDRSMRGKMGEFVVVGRALSDAEIRNIYLAGKP